MANFWEDICEYAEHVGEPIEAVEIISLINSYAFDSSGAFDYLGTKDERDVAVHPILNYTLPPDEARKYLNYEYDPWYGSWDCHNIYAWTKSYVLYVREYDGSTRIASVKRNPS